MMKTFDQAWRAAIAHKKCSFCEEEAIDYEKFKYYCQQHWNKLKGLPYDLTKLNRTSDKTNRKIRRRQRQKK